MQDRKLAFWAKRGGFCEGEGDGKGEGKGKGKGKIKEHGTASPMFWKLLLSAHWLDRSNPALHFFPLQCRDFAQRVGVTGFRPAP